MQDLKPKLFLKSFQFRILILAVLILIVGILLALEFNFWNGNKSSSSKNDIPVKYDFKINYSYLKDVIDRDIDSIITSYGIKKEWITTQHPGDKISKLKQDKSLADLPNTKWFIKNITIPKDVISADINKDISYYLSSTDLSFKANEDIKTADINMVVYAPEDTSMNSTPYFRINIKHSDKIQRETGTFVIILNDIWECKPEEVNDIFENTNEFTYIFPRNFEQIDFQNKIIQMKKDAMIDLILSDKDKTDYDFTSAMDEKDMHQKVKTLTTDFSCVKNFLISVPDPSILRSNMYSLLYSEFSKNEIKCIPDTSILKFNQKDEPNRINIIINLLRSKIIRQPVVIAMLSLNYDDFVNFYEKLYSLKKEGYKFYNYSQYLTRESEKKAREEKLEKKKEKKEKTEKKK